MISGAEKDRIRLLLRETITLLCKNGLPYKREFNLEALIGITLDKKDVLLISLNELIRGQNLADVDPPFTLPVTPTRGSPKKRGGKTGRPRGRPRKHRLPSPVPGDESNMDMEHTEENNLLENDGTDHGTISDHGTLPDGMVAGDPAVTDDVAVKIESQLPSLDTDMSLGLPADMDSSSDEVSSSDNDMGSDDLTDYQRSLLDKMKEAVNQQIRTHSVDRTTRDSTGLQPMDLDESQKIWQRAFETARVTRAPEAKKKSTGGGDGDSKSDGIPQDPVDPNMPVATPMCHICGKTMSTEKNLTKHVRRHLGMFSVYCDECGKGFFDRTDLNSHSAKHKDTKLYQCDICGRSYSHKRGLYKHIRKDHEGKDDKEIEAIIEKASLIHRQPIMDVAAELQGNMPTAAVFQPESSPESLYTGGTTVSQPPVPETPPMTHTPVLSHMSELSQPADLSHNSSISESPTLSHISPLHQHHQPTDLSHHALALAQASMMTPPSMVHHPGGLPHMSLSSGLPPHFQHPPGQQHSHGLQHPYHRY